MKKYIIILTLVVASVFISGCASIVDGRPKLVKINSNPPGAKLTIFDKDGNQVQTLTTPASVRLARGHGYFNGEAYKVKLELPGYYPAETRIAAKLNAWYVGNILVGGAIGLFVVDPLTGAMWTLSPNELSYNMVSASASLSPKEITEAQAKANPVKN
jgi:hypothetical protein